MSPDMLHELDTTAGTSVPAARRSQRGALSTQARCRVHNHACTPAAQWCPPWPPAPPVPAASSSLRLCNTIALSAMRRFCSTGGRGGGGVWRGRARLPLTRARRQAPSRAHAAPTCSQASCGASTPCSPPAPACTAAGCRSPAAACTGAGTRAIAVSSEGAGHGLGWVGRRRWRLAHPAVLEAEPEPVARAVLAVRRDARRHGACLGSTGRPFLGAPGSLPPGCQGCQGGGGGA